MPEALLITGTIGAGKTTVAKAIGELLGARGIPTAVIDLDWLGWVYAVKKPPAFLIAENLTALWRNLQGEGIQRMVLARAVRTRDEVEVIRKAIAPVPVHVIRLEASAETIYERLRGRDGGVELEEHLAQVPAFSAELDDAAIDEVSLSTEAQPAMDVALDALAAIGWG